MAEWQPIETAPKGQDVLLLRANGKHEIADWGRYEKYNGPAFTHWMPLPDPPKDQKVIREKGEMKRGQ